MSIRDLATVLLVVAFSAARANLLIADFNDIATGNLNGKGGGTGWSGNWSGSSTPVVAAGSLSSTLYPLTQSGTPQLAQGNNTTGLRQEYRTAATALAGDVWFSFLASNAVNTNGAGLSFNPPTATPFDNPGSAFLHLLGGNLIYRFGQASDQIVANPIALGATGLIVGRMVINGGGAADSVDVWINPDLIADPDIAHHTPLISSSALHFADTLSVFGLILHNSGGTTSNFARIDNLRVSDGGGNPVQAYADVTGVVPEPSTVALGLLSLAAWRLFRRPS